MGASTPSSSLDAERIDHRVVLRGVPFARYVELADARGERSTPRLTFLQGDLEIMSPSRDHEAIGELWGRLVETYAEEKNLSLRATGSWTVRKRKVQRGAEADQSFVIPARAAKVPDLVLEVVWTSGVLDKLEVYAGLGVPEVWVWRDGRIEVHVLRRGRYERASRSALLPDIDLALVAKLLPSRDHTRATREFRAKLRGRRR